MKKGFTLIEVLVSVSIFSIVMLVATGAVFSIVEANKKTHTLKSVMTNLNFALESMAREMRVGFHYACTSNIAISSADCSEGGDAFHFKANRDVDNDGNYDVSDTNDRIEYTLVDNRIMKTIYGVNSSDTPVAITAREIKITSLKFYATGTAAADGRQPKVVMTIQGYSGEGTTRSDFDIETTITQRALDS